MRSIERFSKIRRENLNEEFYFQSLLEEACTEKEVTSDELERIKFESIKLLADNTQRCSKGKSSSIKLEAAQNIMSSDFFTIGLYLKSLPLSVALETLKNSEVSELYQKGRKIIDHKLKTAWHLYRMVCKTRTETGNHSYNATIEDGIRSFFKAYNTEFEAHEVPASIDYQLMNAVTGLAGVEYINQYLYRLYLENLLCSRFQPHTVHKVMFGYHSGYKDLLINVAEQLLQNALACVLLDKELLGLSLEEKDIGRLSYIVNNESKESLEILLKRAATDVLKRLAISSEALLPYIILRLPDISSRACFAAENNTLHTVFVLN